MDVTCPMPVGSSGMDRRLRLWPTQDDEDRDEAAWAPHACRDRADCAQPVCGSPTRDCYSDRESFSSTERATWYGSLSDDSVEETIQATMEIRKWVWRHSHSRREQEEEVRRQCKRMPWLPVERVRACMPWPYGVQVVLPRYGFRAWSFATNERFLHSTDILQENGHLPAGCRLRRHSI